MIDGFAKEALIVLPSIDFYHDRSSHYHGKLRNAVGKLLDYFGRCGIKTGFYVTDDVALELQYQPDIWLVTLNRGDMFFATKTCVGMSSITGDKKYFEEIYKESARNNEIMKSMSMEARFEVTLKRDAVARRLIMRLYKIIVLFKSGKSTVTSYKPKQDSGVLYIEVNSVSLQVKVYMGDMVMDPVNILGIPNANMPMYEWEVI